MSSVTVTQIPEVIEPTSPAGGSNTNTNNYTTVLNGDGTTTVTFSDGTTATYSGFGTNAETEISTAPAASGTASSTDTTGSSSGSTGTSTGTGTADNIGTGGTGGTSNHSNGGSSTLPVIPASITALATTSVIPNPLHSLASWTYNWSLWWLDPVDYNNLTGDSTDINTGLTAELSSKSYVVAEDGGIYPTRRLPATYGLNYQIQSVNFDTTVGLNQATKSTNLIQGKMEILEPYGVTLIDSLVQSSLSNGAYYNYLTQPYMLQLDFKGYDDAGNPITGSNALAYRKRFPISIIGVKVNVTNKGTVYAIDFTPKGHQALYPKHANVPQDLTIVASTVKDFFTQFATAVNNYYYLEVNNTKREYVDTISFDLDPAIGQSSIVNSAQVSILQANPDNKFSIDLTKGKVTIKKDTPISQVIEKILINSDYLLKQLGLNFQQASADQQQTSLTQILKTFKTSVRASYGGSSSLGTTKAAAFDNQRNEHALTFTYCIGQYAVYDANHPAAPLFSDSRSQTIKNYNYIYTGKNIDIIDLKLNFDTTWYTAINAYNYNYGADHNTASKGIDSALALNGKSVFLSPQILAASGLIPQFGGIATSTPLVYRPVQPDYQALSDANIVNDPGKQVAADVLKSLYTNARGDMVSVDLTIVGDPTLIKQDDWLYTPSPSSASLYNDLSVPQSQWAAQYGHVKMDVGALIVKLTINTPIDIDTDWTNQGGVFPSPGSYQSLFSGQYKIVTIKNNFANGNFTQVLSMVRDVNSDFKTEAAPAQDAVRTNQKNQNSTNSTVNTTDTSTPAGQATIGANGQVTSAYDATRYGNG